MAEPTSIHTRIRELSQTAEGRRRLAVWAGTPKTDDWQQAFEKAGDYANDRLGAMYGNSLRNPYRLGSSEWYAHNAQQSLDSHAVLLGELKTSG